jgi:hypothetical protein
MVEELFKENSGIKTGTEVSISGSQNEPVKMESDAMITTFTYGRSWQDQTLDNSGVLNNFQHMLDVADDHAMPTLPSYPAELGVFEEFGALNFSFPPSARTSSYLGKPRHLFAEREGLANQFRLFVQATNPTGKSPRSHPILWPPTGSRACWKGSTSTRETKRRSPEVRTVCSIGSRWFHFCQE